jgi:hypothetical protein
MGLLHLEARTAILQRNEKKRARPSIRYTGRLSTSSSIHRLGIIGVSILISFSSGAGPCVLLGAEHACVLHVRAYLRLARAESKF